MIKREANYALRALMELASSKARRSSRSLAAATRIPLRYLENILRKLTQARLLESERGTAGGYRLNKAATAISLAEVIVLFDHSIEPTPCSSDQHPKACANCPGLGACTLRPVWVKARNALWEVYSTHFISDLAAGGALPS